MSNITAQFINIGQTKIAEDTVIYRVFSGSRLSEMFRTKKLTLAAPHKWDDPFENFLARRSAYCIELGMEVGIQNLFRNFYGQCWTLNPESDAMWRIYSHDKNGARVTTTVGRLFRSIYNPDDTFAEMSYYIGSVSYKTEQEIRGIFADPKTASSVAFDSTGRGQTLPLFVKRTEFSHEREVRLLYRYHSADSEQQRAEEVWQFGIDPNALFDEVMLDPRMAPDEAQKHRDILNECGFNKSVKQSALYQVPDLQIKITFDVIR